MGIEIERKFLVVGDGWKRGVACEFRQGYLSTDPARTVRLRVAGDQAFLTIKGKTEGATRAEFEYNVPVADANNMLDALCERPLISKVRFTLEYCGLTWEVDEFREENSGLVIAEVELTSEQQKISLPDWIGKEVTGDPRYYNANLIKHPFRAW